MRAMIRAFPLASALLLLAGCSKIQAVTGPAPVPGYADFSVYVAMGTSVTMGWQSGGAVDRHQTRAFPALFARAAGSSRFDQPLVNGDGIPALATIVQFGPPLIISNAGRVNGSPTNSALPTAYHHMGIGYAILPDVVDTTNYNNAPHRAEMFALVQRGRGSLLAQVAGQINPRPTFISFEYGANEILGAATQGSGTPLIPAATWAGLLATVLNGLQAQLPNAKLALFTVPDVTTVPFATTFPPLVLGANGRPVTPYVPLLGPGNVPLVPGQDLVLLTAGPMLAAGQGYPVGTTAYGSGNPVPGTGVGLPGSVVLDAAEVASLRAAVAAYNAAIVTEATNRGAALVDFHGLLTTAHASGFDIGGTKYTTAFITGGLFSLDGVHPNDLSHGLICNALITAVNTTFHSAIAPVDLEQAKSTRADGAVPARFEGPALPAVNTAAADFAAAFPWRGAGTP